MRKVFHFLLPTIHTVLANTEKTIFLGPETVNVSVKRSLSSDDLYIRVISPQHNKLRTYIPAEFPTIMSELGRPSWFLLDGLCEGQRYEVRICWAATVTLHPSKFRYPI